MNDRRWLLALKIGVSTTLLARGWLTFRWDSPIRNLLWNEDWLARPIESLTRYRWEDYALHSGPYLDGVFKVLGVLLMVTAALPWIASRKRAAGWLWLPFGILVLDAVGRWTGADYLAGMALEPMLQMSAPLALWLAIRHPSRPRVWLGVVLAAAALTFVGHGLYASGAHPVPLSFQTMTMDILHIGQEPALGLLEVVGWVDFVAALCLVVPTLRKPALIYMIVWGALTALARIPPYFGLDQAWWGLDPWLAETLVRTPHWLLPLLAFFLLGSRRGAVSERPA